MVAALTLLSPALGSAADNPNRKTVGQLETLRIEEAKLDFVARIDTGARVTSLHATDIRVDDPAAEKKDNAGKTIHFRTSNAVGEDRDLTAVISKVTRVRNAQGSEYRYVVELTLLWDGDRKKVLINLRDRSAMRYKLLIGRNWLKDDYLVNIDLNRPPQPQQ